jgi:8-oxo-dGTP pyrophosphatase MutT (NUDIX family)
VPEERYARRSARVLLLDGSSRVLLLKFAGELGASWITPGGGVDDGEPLPVAAARELHEEVGLRVDPDRLGPVVAQSSGYADLGFARGVFRDDFFCYRVDAHQVDMSGQEPFERAQLVDYRWWTVAELTTTGETVYPYGLAPLLAVLIAGRIPPEPVLLPWHH